LLLIFWKNHFKHIKIQKTFKMNQYDTCLPIQNYIQSNLLQNKYIKHLQQNVDHLQKQIQILHIQSNE
jgi:hypothetical protein